MDDDDGAGHGVDDGARDTEDEHDNDGDEVDYRHRHQRHHSHRQRSVLATVHIGWGVRLPPPALHRLPGWGRLGDDNDNRMTMRIVTVTPPHIVIIIIVSRSIINLTSNNNIAI